MGIHLLPEGGTEQTSTAPPNSGYGVFSSRINPSSIKTKPVKGTCLKTNKQFKITTVIMNELSIPYNDQ